MKKILTLFILCIGISLSAQQSLKLELNKIWGYNSPGNSLAVTWFRTNGIQSGYALRLGYFSAESEVRYYDGKTDHVQLDVVKRWHNPSTKKVSFYGELGISGMVMNENMEPYYDSCCDFFCDCLFAPISTPGRFKREGEGGFDYNKDNKYYVLYFLPGASIGSGLDINFTKYFYMGVQARLNAYYSVNEEDHLLAYFHYGMNAGFRF